MDNKFRYAGSAESRRLLVLMGTVFGMIFFVQYVELPNGNIFTSSLEVDKSQLARKGNFPSMNSSVPTGSSSLNSTDLSVDDGVSSTVKVSDEKDSGIADGKDDFDPENNEILDDNLNDDIDPEDESPSEQFMETDHNSTSKGVVRSTSSPSEKTRETGDELFKPDYTSKNSGLLDHNGVGDGVQSVGNTENKFANQENFPASKSPLDLPTYISSPENPETSSSTESILQKNQNPDVLKANPSVPVSDPSISSTPATKKKIRKPVPVVVPISEINDMLLQSQVSYRASKPRWSSRADQELLNARILVENAPIIKENSHFDVNLYRNFSSFKRSYELMEQTLKVYIYAEGEQPIFHRPHIKGIYASEGWFMKLLKANKKFVTKKPNRAHLFYLPFSSKMLEVVLYVPESHDHTPSVKYLSNFMEMITTKYPFWNRTDGADHLVVACHDWATYVTGQTMSNCIRALCNADVQGGFQFGKDASLPETNVRIPQNPLRGIGGKPPSKRNVLAFFAGQMHGHVRPKLLKQWENKDPDMKISGPMPKVKGEMNYIQYMKSSKYCICPKGWEVNSPRVVEAIFYECVPVIISDNFVPPFFETLNWEAFAVFVLEKDIPNLKDILVSIPTRSYLSMQKRVKQVQQHFLWHSRPVKYDVFHMILHSIWHNRLFQSRS